VVAFVAGLALATPPVEYLAAMIAILASGALATEQFAAALMFTLIAFTVVELPLVTYLASPDKTLRRIRDCARKRWPFGQFHLTRAGGFVGWARCPATSSACGIRIW
jgi:hypothetical protein